MTGNSSPKSKDNPMTGYTGNTLSNGTTPQYDAMGHKRRSRSRVSTSELCLWLPRPNRNEFAALHNPLDVARVGYVVQRISGK